MALPELGSDCHDVERPESIARTDSTKTRTSSTVGGRSSGRSALGRSMRVQTFRQTHPTLTARASAIRTTSPRSQRALLGAAVGAAVATVASALGRPVPVRAGDDGDVILGAANSTTTTTSITANADTVFATVSSSGTGTAASGVASGGTAINGTSWVGTSVSRQSEAGVGVHGVGLHSLDLVRIGTGIYGESTYGDGVVGRSSIYTGVHGHAGSAPAAAAPPKTGVYGYAAQDADARGVLGKTTAGQGVRGEATSGTSVQGFSATGTGVYANATTYRSGVYVAAARKNYPSTGRFRIYLNKAATGTTYVTRQVLGTDRWRLPAPPALPAPAPAPAPRLGPTYSPVTSSRGRREGAGSAPAPASSDRPWAASSWAAAALSEAWLTR